MDLFTARRSIRGEGYETALPVPGGLNTAADEFDATYLSDGVTIVFSQAPDLKVDTVRLLYGSLRNGRYDAGTLLPDSVNASGKNAYGPMLDWSRPDHVTFSGERPEAHAGAADLYVIRYRLISR
jgi:hypothetical protein